MLAAVVQLAGASLLLRMTGGSLLQVGAVSLILGGVSGLLPAINDGRLDPSQVL